ncbi:YhgE/Pip domain-containing protein [Brochothrix campestris]|uniref:Membrane protein n=1 Tax=Brochothrix campestris FSL F6-1037 TaxID=1265861 RepID=W7D9B1_9LIST|nr:ABC transporter permease [Brochothrix campestris]EUJ41823.1 membrane protein [Brochothrix campestris FSL F6-1037]
MNFKKFMGLTGVKASIFMGIFYAVAMLLIFLTGYSALPANMDELKVAIVNDDKGQAGTQISKELAKSLPFEINSDLTNENAMKKLEDNKYALVIHIPESFSDNATKGKAAEIDFTVNEASATMVSSAMKSVVSEINTQLSANFSTKTAEGVLLNMNVPKEQSAAIAKQIDQAYVGNYVIINDVPDGMNNNMLPMFLTMACYVGAMIGAMQLVSAFKQSRGRASRVKLFGYVQGAALIIAIVSTIFAVTVAFFLTEMGSDVLIKIAGQQILLYMAAFNVCAIFTFLIGDGGMILNIPILLSQTIANGATMPREMMYGYFNAISHVSPMYYSVQSYFAVIFGSTSQVPFLWGLAAVAVGAMLINALVVTFVHKKLPVDTQPVVL